MNQPNGPEDERMRRLLDDAVADVEPRDALDSIRARTAGTARARRPWILGVGAAVVATAATVAAVAVMGENPGTTGAQDPGYAAPSTATSSVGGATGEPSQETSPSDPATGQAGGSAVPVYYIGDTNQGPRLFREFHRLDVTGRDPIAVAVNEAVATEPLDGDYRSGWPAGTTVTRVDFDGSDVLTVYLENPDGLRERPGGMSEEDAALAVEQLLYTAQASSQTRAPVQLLVNDGRTDTVLGVPAAEPLAQGDWMSTLSLVMVTTPEEGARVSDSFVAEGIASSFEATVPWQIRQGDRVVKEGYSTARGWMDKLYPWRTGRIEVSDLSPGEYTFVAMTSDPSGGAEGSGPFEDTKQITVVE